MTIPQLPVNSQLPPDLAGQLAQLQMRQQLSQALLGQSIQPTNPTRTAGRYVVPISPLEGFSKMATTALLSKGIADTAGKETGLYAQAQGRRNSALSDALLGDQSSKLPPGLQTDPNGVPGFNAIPGQPSSVGQSPMGSNGRETPQDIYREALKVAPQYGVDALTLLGDGPYKLRLEAALRRQDPTETAKLLSESGESPDSPAGRAAYAGKLNPITAMREGAGGIQIGPDGKPYFSIFSPKLAQGQSMGPNGVEVAPGYMGAQQQTGELENKLAASRTTQEEQARLPFRITDVKQASGAVVPTPTAQFLPGNVGGQRPPVMTPPNLPPQPVAPQPQVAPPAPQQIQPGQPPAAAPTAPAMPSQSLQMPPYARPEPSLMARPAPPSNVQGTPLTAHPQSSLGKAPIADPWVTMPKIQIPKGIGQSTLQEATSKNQAHAALELTTKYGEIAASSNQRKAFNDQALSLVDSADTGFAAARTADVKNILIKIVPGLTEDSFKNTPSATIALQKDLVNAATQKAKQQFGARLTQSEVMLMLQKAAPNADMPKAAIKYLLNSDNAQLDYQTQQANDLTKYLRNGGDPQAFESWYAKAFPLTRHVENVHLQQGGQQNTGKQVQRTGTVNGKKVIQYTDGSVEYAN